MSLGKGLLCIPLGKFLKEELKWRGYFGTLLFSDEVYFHHLLFRLVFLMEKGSGVLRLILIYWCSNEKKYVLVFYEYVMYFSI